MLRRRFGEAPHRDGRAGARDRDCEGSRAIEAVVRKVGARSEAPRAVEERANAVAARARVGEGRDRTVADLDSLRATVLEANIRIRRSARAGGIECARGGSVKCRHRSVCP